MILVSVVQAVLVVADIEKKCELRKLHCCMILFMQGRQMVNVESVGLGETRSGRWVVPLKGCQMFHPIILHVDHPARLGAVMMGL